MKPKQTLRLLAFGLGVTLLFVGCASGSRLATGPVGYKATDPASLQVLTQYPERYETVGLVEASAPKGYLREAEHAARNALEELKRQAALLGATAIVIKDYGSQTVPDFTFGDDDPFGLIFTTEHKTIRGEAIRL